MKPAQNELVLSWARGWLRPFESHVSVAWRLCLENVLRPKDLRNLLVKNVLSRFPNYDSFISETEEIERLLHMPGQIYRPVSRDDYIQRDEDTFLCRRHLRICRSCVEHGYHSTLHQIMCIRNCPFHDQPLTRFCPSCTEPFYGFDLGLDTLVSPWSCRQCGWPHFGVYPAALPLDPDAERTNAAGSKFAQWINSINKLIDADSWLNPSILANTIDRGRAAELASFFSGPPDAIKSYVFHNTGLTTRSLFGVRELSGGPPIQLSSLIDRAYATAHDRVTAETPAVSLQKNARVTNRNWEWEWDPENRCYAPRHNYFSPERLAYRWWVSAFEGPVAGGLYVDPKKRKSVRCILYPHPKILRLFCDSERGMSAYFYFSFAAYLDIARSLELYLEAARVHTKSYQISMREAWHAFAHISHLTPSSDAFPLQCIKRSPIHDSDGPDVVLFWINNMPDEICRGGRSLAITIRNNPPTGSSVMVSRPAFRASESS